MASHLLMVHTSKTSTVKLPEPPAAEGLYVDGREDAFFDEISRIEEKYGVLDAEGTHRLGRVFYGWTSYEIPYEKAPELANEVVDAYNKYHKGGSSGFTLHYFNGTIDEMEEILAKQLGEQ